MQRSSFPWFWVALAAILLLLPGPAGRLLLDLLGGLTLVVLLLPLLAIGGGFLAWQLLRSRIHTCDACGATSFGMDNCPACGSPFDSQTVARGQPRGDDSLAPGQVTIDVEVVDLPPAGDGDQRRPPTP